MSAAELLRQADRLAMSPLTIAQAAAGRQWAQDVLAEAEQLWLTANRVAPGAKSRA